MGIKVYNTLTRQTEEFMPLLGKRVRMFVCGPTVYDYSHIGHAKTYIAYDVIANYLRYRGYDVTYIQNITDIDDKIINRGNEQNRDPLQISDEFTKAHLEDMDTLMIKSVNKYIKCSQAGVVEEIIRQAKGLIEKGYAYEAGGNVYYSISKFPDYGRLSGHMPDETAQSRIEEDPYKKEPFDFVIWKNAKPGEPTWDSPWGKGRPGWHIEDTAISIPNLGEQYDLHGGGEDLIFPHHEAEIAIAEALTGKKPFVKYWLHTSFLKIEGEKMAKSLKNFITIRDAVKKHGAELIKFYFAIAPHYRPLDYSEKHILETGKSLEKIHNTIDNLNFLLPKASLTDNAEIDVASFREKFVAAMDNNFNTADAISVVFDLVRDLNTAITAKQALSKNQVQEALKFFKEVGGIMGLDFAAAQRGEAAPSEVVELVAQREQARKKRDWAKADEIRAKAASLGWEISDTPQGPKVRRSGKPEE